jgi:hypothetical protein
VSVKKLRILLKRFNLIFESGVIHKTNSNDVLEHTLGTCRPLAPAGALFQMFLHVGFAEQDEEEASQDLKAKQQMHVAA